MFFWDMTIFTSSKLMWIIRSIEMPCNPLRSHHNVQIARSKGHLGQPKADKDHPNVRKDLSYISIGIFQDCLSYPIFIYTSKALDILRTSCLSRPIQSYCGSSLHPFSPSKYHRILYWSHHTIQINRSMVHLN